MKKIILLLLLVPLILMPTFAQPGDTGARRYYDDDNDITIKGEVFEGGDGIIVSTKAHVTFDSCYFINVNTSFGAVYGSGEEGSHITVKNCFFISSEDREESTYWSPYNDQIKSVRVYGYSKKCTVQIINNTGNGYRGIWLQTMGAGSVLEVKYNYWKNIEGRIRNGDDPSNYHSENSQFLMINEVENSHIDVQWNYVENEALKGRQEDVFNFSEIKATAEDPTLIANNVVYGAYHQNPFVEGQDHSGTGFQVDGLQGSYNENMVIRNNYLIDCTIASLAISNGRNISVYKNVAVSDGYDREGRFVSSGYWRGLLLGNPFWNAGDGVKDSEAYQNIIGVPQNVGDNGEQIWNADNQIEVLNNNTSLDNTFITNREDAASAEIAYLDEFWDKVNEAGIVIGAGGSNPTDPIPPVDPEPPTDPTDPERGDGKVTKAEYRELRNGYRDLLRVMNARLKSW